MKRSSQPAPAQSLSLDELRPELFAVGMPLSRVEQMPVPVSLSPQMVLHWLALSSAFALDTPAARLLIQECIGLGGDPMALDSCLHLRRAHLNPPEDVVCAGMGHPLRVQSASPLGSAILKRNTQAIVGLSQAARAMSCYSDPYASVTRLVGAKGGIAMDAWALCAHMGTMVSISLLNTGFAIAADDEQHARQMGKAICVALRECGENAYVSTPTQTVVRKLLLLGAQPEHLDVQACGVDPAWVVTLVSDKDDHEHALALRQLIRSGFPLNPADPRVEPALHVAARCGNAPSLIDLLDAGANPRAKDSNGRTLEEAVHAEQNHEILNVMKVWTARRLALDAMGLFQAFQHPDRSASLMRRRR